MKLQDLVPKAATHIAELQPYIHPTKWQSTMPSNFPEKLLLALARDFRSVEYQLLVGGDSADGAAGFSAALAIMLGLLTAHPARRADHISVDLSLEDLLQAMQIYQLALEREITTRLTGIPALNTEDVVIQALEKYVSS